MCSQKHLFSGLRDSVFENLRNTSDLLLFPLTKVRPVWLINPEVECTHPLRVGKG